MATLNSLPTELLRLIMLFVFKQPTPDFTKLPTTLPTFHDPAFTTSALRLVNRRINAEVKVVLETHKDNLFCDWRDNSRETKRLLSGRKGVEQGIRDYHNLRNSGKHWAAHNMWLMDATYRASAAQLDSIYCLQRIKIVWPQQQLKRVRMTLSRLYNVDSETEDYAKYGLSSKEYEDLSRFSPPDRNIPNVYTCKRKEITHRVKSKIKKGLLTGYNAFWGLMPFVILIG